MRAFFEQFIWLMETVVKSREFLPLKVAFYIHCSFLLVRRDFTTSRWVLQISSESKGKFIEKESVLKANKGINWCRKEGEVRAGENPQEPRAKANHDFSFLRHGKPRKREKALLKN